MIIIKNSSLFRANSKLIALLRGPNWTRRSPDRLVGRGLPSWATLRGGRASSGSIDAPPRPKRSKTIPTSRHSRRRRVSRCSGSSAAKPPARASGPTGLAAVVDSLRPDLIALWRALSLDEQRRALRHLRAYWDVHRHRIAPEIDARLSALRAEGRLKVFAGSLAEARSTPEAIDHRAFAKPRDGVTKTGATIMYLRASERSLRAQAQVLPKRPSTDNRPLHL